MDEIRGFYSGGLSFAVLAMVGAVVKPYSDKTIWGYGCRGWGNQLLDNRTSNVMALVNSLYIGTAHNSSQ
jgi:hypothetical protein